jgi:hypothetical protein
MKGQRMQNHKFLNQIVLWNVFFAIICIPRAGKLIDIVGVPRFEDTQGHFTAQLRVPSKYELLKSALSQRPPAIEGVATTVVVANAALSLMVAW